MKHTEVWYACQMMLYELRLAARAARVRDNTDSPMSKVGSTTISVPWEIRK